MNKHLEKIKSILKTKEIQRKIIFSFIILVVFRILAAIPVVGIPADALKQLFAGTDFGDLLSTVSGGVLETASIVAIGLSPYINASIVFQLLGSVVPRIEEMRKEGPEGRRKISMYTRFLTVPLAILQSFVIYSTLKGFGLIGDLSTIEMITMSATLTGGAMVMMWFGELISESGVGGGSSYLIFLGIVAGIPGTVSSNFTTMDIALKIGFIIFAVILVASVVFVTQAERRINVQYSRRVRSGGSADNYIPVKLTQFGVMPVIFAISLLSFPQLIIQFILSRDYSDKVVNIAQWIKTLLENPWFSNISTFVLVVAFALFYLTVVFDTDDLAENLQKQGAFIQGVRPGKNTSEYLKKVSFRLAIVGALFLALISVLPNLLILGGFMQRSIVTGTGLLIAVGVVLDIKREVESMVVVRSYDKYL